MRELTQTKPLPPHVDLDGYRIPPSLQRLTLLNSPEFAEQSSLTVWKEGFLNGFVFSQYGAFSGRGLAILTRDWKRSVSTEAVAAGLVQDIFRSRRSLPLLRKVYPSHWLLWYSADDLHEMREHISSVDHPVNKVPLLVIQSVPGDQWVLNTVSRVVLRRSQKRLPSILTGTQHTFGDVRDPRAVSLSKNLEFYYLKEH